MEKFKEISKVDIIKTTKTCKSLTQDGVARDCSTWNFLGKVLYIHRIHFWGLLQIMTIEA
jgi:hypothetical protein